MLFANCELFMDGAEFGAFLHVYADTEDMPHDLIGLYAEPIRTGPDGADSDPEVAIARMIQFLARAYHSTAGASLDELEVVFTNLDGVGAGPWSEQVASRRLSDD